MAGDDLRRLSSAAEQWMALCRGYMDANRDYRDKVEAQRRGQTVDEAAMRESRARLDKAMDACRFFIRHRTLPPAPG